MTVVRLASTWLWVLYLAALDDEIRTELDALRESENFVTLVHFTTSIGQFRSLRIQKPAFTPLQTRAPSIPNCRSLRLSVPRLFRLGEPTR